MDLLQCKPAPRKNRVKSTPNPYVETPANPSGVSPKEKAQTVFEAVLDTDLLN